MAFHDNANDLQLEDVEDYSADYPPGGYPNAGANMAPVGNAEDAGYKTSSSPKYRRGVILAKLRKNKWTVGLLAVVIIVLIGILVAMVGKDDAAPKSSTSPSADGEGVPPPTVDPASLDQDVLAVLKASIKGVYARHSLNATLLDEADSPQRKALLWMALDKSVNSIEHTEKLQLFVLAVFFYATNMVPTDFDETPRPWLLADKWLTNAHSCDWMGVNCNTNKDVVSIELPRNRLSGKIPADLVIIGAKLDSLVLNANVIAMRGDDFDAFTNLTNLKALVMDDNYLYHDSGLPPQFQHLIHMRKIILSYNLFEGELDSEAAVLGSMTKLTHLEMESNFFSGTMPSAIGKMDQLVYLYLRRNAMTFNLNFLKSGMLGNLFTLWLDSNKMTGVIPTEIGQLTGLVSLSLTNSTLSGKIPEQIGNLTQLRRLWLYSNKLTGPIPSSLSNLTSLEIIELHNNSLVGDMPDGVCTILSSSDYEFKSLTSDCKSEVTCDSPGCCTECF